MLQEHVGLLIESDLTIVDQAEKIKVLLQALLFKPNFAGTT